MERGRGNALQQSTEVVLCAAVGCRVDRTHLTHHCLVCYLPVYLLCFTHCISASANNYSLPAATTSALGGVKIGYSENGKNYPIELSAEKMFVKYMQI